MPPFARIIASSALEEIVSLGGVGAALDAVGLAGLSEPMLSVVPTTDDGAVLRVVVSPRKRPRRASSHERWAS